jgi:hypothetical protein
MIPNLQALVEQTKEQYPRAWNHCHIPGDPEAWDFIILAARKMYDQNPLFGCNGKRGTDDLSWDAVNWRGDIDDPANVIDCVAGAGGSNPQPAWIVTNTTGKWFNPYQCYVYYDYSNGNGGGGGKPEDPDYEDEFDALLAAQKETTQAVKDVNSTLQAMFNMLDGHLGAIAINTSNSDSKLDEIKVALADIRARMDQSFSVRVRL